MIDFTEVFKIYLWILHGKNGYIEDTYLEYVGKWKEQDMDINRILFKIIDIVRGGNLNLNSNIGLSVLIEIPSIFEIFW